MFEKFNDLTFSAFFIFFASHIQFPHQFHVTILTTTIGIRLILTYSSIFTYQAYEMLRIQHAPILRVTKEFAQLLVAPGVNVIQIQ